MFTLSVPLFCVNGVVGMSSDGFLWGNLMFWNGNVVLVDYICFLINRRC